MSRLMLVTLDISKWTSSIRDPEVSRKAAEAEGANPQLAGKYTKNLVAKDALKEIRRVIRETRSEHERLTGPYMIAGTRILTTDLYNDYVAMIARQVSELRVVVDGVANSLQEEIKVAKDFLGHMFDLNDYPSDEEFRNAWKITAGYAPVPESQKIKEWVSVLGANEVAVLEEKHASAISKAIDDAHSEVVGRLVDRARNFIERLSAKEEGGQIYTTTLSILLEEAELIARGLGIKDDPRLVELAEEIQAAVASTSADKLRFSETERSQRKAAIDKALRKFEGVMG